MGNAVLAVFLGGGTGSVLRFLISWLLKPWANIFPYHTLLSNVLACIVFALFIRLAPSVSFLQNRENLVLAGFCGGLSTFSTFSYDPFIFCMKGKFFYFS
jgi:CrcB protein